MNDRTAWYPHGFRLPRLPEFPPGVGVPGKPITLDQFYTEDVFHMLVPDDGERGRPAPLGMRERDRQIAPFTDLKMERSPGYGNDGAMVTNPDVDKNACPDPNGVKSVIDRHRTYVRELEKARAGRASAKSARERADWDVILRDYEGALAQSRPAYEAALKCTTAV